MRRYSRQHVWLEDGQLGLTQYAIDQMDGVVLIAMERGSYNMGDCIGVVESRKAAEEVSAPCTLRVVEVNSEAEQRPERVDGDTWLCRVEGVSGGEWRSRAEYEQWIAGLA